MPRLRRSHALVFLLGLSLLGWAAWAWLDVPRALAWAQRLHGPIPALVLLPLQTAVALSLSPIPSDVVGVALCVVYGFPNGVLLVWTSWMLAAWIEYGLVRRIAKRVDAAPTRTRLPGWLRHLPVDHPGFLICARWFPLGPHLVNSAAGAAGVPLWRYTWTAAVGIAPVALLVGAVAAGLLAAGDTSSPQNAAAAALESESAAASTASCHEAAPGDSGELIPGISKELTRPRDRPPGRGNATLTYGHSDPHPNGRLCAFSSTTAESRIWASATACRCSRATATRST